MARDRTSRIAALKLRRMDLEAHLSDPASKQDFVTPMFDLVAPRYDRFTQVFSLGMDRGWKRQLLEDVKRVAPPKATVLDLACGTGDLALEMSRMLPAARVTGIDISKAMIDLAEQRRASARAESVRFSVGDMANLDSPDASVDVVTVGYGFRNVPDHRQALREVARVLRPGGHLLSIDFYRPQNVLWRKPLTTYLTAAGGLVGWLWHRAPVAYAYLGPSVEHFVSWQEFSRSLEESGFAVERVRRKVLGAIAIHIARKL
jgi:demethylmenaquinone methyltransferase/2-methoxy-6-polyprenyl-1,4-benzoquinol methylase